ncbi:MAG: hypothetical protein ABI366_09485, partial [Ginsengibacter sp.]
MLILVLWILIQTTFFQTFIIHRVAHKLSKELNTTVSIKKINLELFDRMDMENLLVLDHQKDTLLFAGSAKVSITDWFFFKKNISLNYIGLSDAFINLHRSDSTWNYQFMVDYFSGPGNKKTDTTSSGINLDLKVVNLKNIRIWQKDGWRGEDMLVSIGRLNIHADQFDLNRNVIKLSEIQLEKPSFTLYDYEGNRPGDTSSSSASIVQETEGLQWNPDQWQLSAKYLKISDGIVAVEKAGHSAPVMNEFDENHIIISSINGTFKNIKLKDDTLQSFVSLSARDRGGFVIKKLSADFKFTPAMMEFKDLDILTKKSHLQNYYAMHYQHFNDDMQDFIHNVTVDGHFKNSKLSSDDLAYFAPDTRSWETDFYLSGRAHGKIDNLTAHDMVIKAGENNYLSGDISLRGLPDIDKTFIDLRTNELRSNYVELAKLIPDLKGITNPNLKAFGNIYFAGSFTGYVNDFVTFGTLKTDIGMLQTDVHLRIPAKGRAVYNGKVSTTNFQLGKFIGNNDIGNIVFDGKVN